VVAEDTLVTFNLNERQSDSSETKKIASVHLRFVFICIDELRAIVREVECCDIRLAIQGLEYICELRARLTRCAKQYLDTF
jgi:hypothetical protein